jgi:hypothetical protein
LGGQVAFFAVLLAVGCNVITGVGDLRVVDDGCGLDAGACGGAASEQIEPVKPLPPDPDAAGAGEDPCAGMRAITEFTPSNVIGLEGSSPCGSTATPGSGGDGTRGASAGAAGAPGAGAAAAEVDAGAAGAGMPAMPAMFCTPGSVRACTGNALCAGAQTCAADGGSFSPCLCPAAPTQPIRGSIAAACASDAECAPGLECVTSADRTGPFSAGEQPGGPQNGYCSRPCGVDADCRASDPLAICLGPGGGRDHCFQACNVLAQTFPAQCNGRDDLTCVPLLVGDVDRSYCAPACHDDASCTPGFCNLATGLCQDAKPTGKPLGAGCAGNEECAAGVCFALRDDPPVCTGLCTFGSVAGCGFAEDAPERDAACLDTALDGNAGPGLCTELCDTDDDCEQRSAGWVCTPWSLDVLAERVLTFERIGFCELDPGGLDSGGLEPDGSEAGCSEECLFAGDGECDDGGRDSLTDLCLLGTDCSDCGAR